MSRAIPIRLFAFLAILAILLMPAGNAAAETTLASSDPVSGAILQVAPTEIRLSFSQPVDPATTSARLVDRFGDEVAGTTIRFENDVDLIVVPPPGLPAGAWTVLYEGITISDASIIRGMIPFAIGGAADVRLVSAPLASANENEAPRWLSIPARWLALGGSIVALAIWPIWAYTVSSALRRKPKIARVALGVVRRVALISFAAAVVGSALELVGRAIDRDESVSEAIRIVLFETRFGDLWLIRVLLLGVLASLLSVVNWVRPGRSRLLTAIALLTSFALPIPFSLDSNAADATTGRTFAIVSDYLHILAAGLWGGGVLFLAALAFGLLRTRADASIRDVVQPIAQRFAFVSIAAWIVLTLSGAYAAWLQVGNLDVARATSYGNAFLVKLALTVALLAFLATSWFAASRLTQQSRWTSHQLRGYLIQSVAVVLILLATSWMMAVPPARDEFIDSTSGFQISLADDGATAELWLSPAAAGPNHYQLTYVGTAPPDSVATLILTSPLDGTDPVIVELTSVGPNNWENHGAELSLAGEWLIEASITSDASFEWRASTAVDVVPEAEPLPGQPWRFEAGAIAGILMLVIGAIALGRVIGIPGGRSRKETAGIGVAGLAIGAVFLLSARLEPPPSFVLADNDTLARGSAVWAQQCLSCHGVNGGGDGPDAAGLPVPPADFADPVHQLHSDSSLAIMIQNGFPLSGMPAFGDILTAGEIADVVAYIRALGVGNSAIETPAAADCTIDPRDIDTLIGITSSNVTRSDAVAEWPIGTEASDADTVAVGATIRQFVACSNAGDYERILATESLGFLAPQFARLDDVSRAIALERAENPAPLALDEQISIESIEPARKLDDGRLATRVVTLDPVNHPHRLEAVVILAEEDGIWRIDEIRLPESDDTEQSASNWPIVADLDGYRLELTIGDPVEQGRPLRIDLTDDAGNSIDGATGTITLVPRAVGIPTEHELSNVDPGRYFAYGPPLEPGAYVAEVMLTMPDGSEIVAGFTFVL